MRIWWAGFEGWTAVLASTRLVELWAQWWQLDGADEKRPMRSMATRLTATLRGHMGKVGRCCMLGTRCARAEASHACCDNSNFTHTLPWRFTYLLHFERWIKPHPQTEGFLQDTYRVLWLELTKQPTPPKLHSNHNGKLHPFSKSDRTFLQNSSSFFIQRAIPYSLAHVFREYGRETSNLKREHALRNSGSNRQLKY